jgi:serine/threonine-protein kinase HipA
LEEGNPTAIFEYTPDFAQSGIEVAPLMMPLSSRTYSFPDVPETFHGLPGLLADSLPDRFGNHLIDAWLATTGRDKDSFTPVERLCYVGKRGMGALEFEPVIAPDLQGSDTLQVGQLVDLAGKILTYQSELKTSFQADDTKAMQHIFQVGTSAGGARAKAVIAWNRKTNEVRSGQINAGDGFEYWLIKFDGVQDKKLADPQGYCAVEYAYHKMAMDCGITMSECCLFEEGGRRHFMTRRFDRLANGGKLPMQTLAALAHFDFYRSGLYSYEQALDIMRRLDLPAKETAQFFRRMVFNIVARNQDDHVKNTAFLMDRRGNWSLAPAYDVTYSYGQNWTSNHQMTLGGKRDNFSMDNFETCGNAARLKRGEARRIVNVIRRVVHGWHDYADDCGVRPDQRDKIQNVLRLEPFE